MKPLRPWVFFSSLVCSFQLVTNLQVKAFLPGDFSSHIRRSGISKTTFSPSQLSSRNNKDEDEDRVNVGPEKSRMSEYISKYLGKNKKTKDGDETGDDEDDGFCSENLVTSTHLIAIPMDTCHELLIELESVQRAILYHCPILLDACIPPATTRLPLMYVQAKHQNSELVTSFLAKVAQQLIQKHLLATSADDAEEDEGLLNANGERPFTLTFQSLEIDGANNNVLNTVGLASDEGTKKLRAFLDDLQKEIEGKGWKAAFPPDPQRSEKGGFRPRIPFMELPKDFDDNLSRFKDKDTEITDEDAEFLTSEQGGNGISPIFWCQWWDDVFGRNIRMREIGVYPRQISDATPGDDGLISSMFYLPYETVPLPDGNAAMTQTENKFQKYQDQRLEEEQERIYQEQEGIEPNAVPNRNSEPDILMTKTRERLESVYVNSAEDIPIDSIIQEEVPSEQTPPVEQEGKTSEEKEDEMLDLDLASPTASPDDFMDDWMKQRIKATVENRESVKSRKHVKKEKPPIEDNPVFKAYKEGTLVPKDQRPKPLKKKLGPYPGREHFFGIWRVVTSPTGFQAEESTDETSENLILRVDGTTAGGPILDQETRQKAAGGTWKMIVEEDGDVKLRIRLVIPPMKERILVMEGLVNRMNLGSNMPMASKAFGIPHLEAMAKEANQSTEDLMHCGGEVSSMTEEFGLAFGVTRLLPILFITKGFRGRRGDKKE